MSRSSRMIRRSRRSRESGCSREAGGAGNKRATCGAKGAGEQGQEKQES